MLVSRLTIKIFILLLTLFFMVSTFPFQAYAEPTPNINYQGKLTDATGLAVPDGTYNMRFWLLTSNSIATTSAEWTESLTGANKVQVTNGLFSVMLGSTSALTGVDFNQPLYLGVEIGGSGAVVWDGEMSPRKLLGTVPAAFEAFKLGGVASSSFLRSDQADTLSATTANTLLTITQSGAGDILNLFDGGTEVLTVTDGGNVGIGTTSPYAKLSVVGNSVVTGKITSSYFTATSTTVASTLPITNMTRLGVGTTTSSASLHVNGTGGGSYVGGYPALQVLSVTSDTSWNLVYGNNTVAQTSWMANYLDNSGNLHFGSGINSNFSILQIRNSASVQAVGINSYGLYTVKKDLDVFPMTANSAAVINISSNRTSPVVNNLMGTLNFYADKTVLDTNLAQINAYYNGSNGGYLGFNVGAAAGTEALRIANDGNIGIGTTSPYAKLSVTNTGSAPSFLVEDSTSPDTSPFIITSTGNVGIGTTVTPAKLTVVGQTLFGTSTQITGINGMEIVSGDSVDNYIQILADYTGKFGLTYQFNSATGDFNIYSDYYDAGPEPGLVFGTFSNKTDQLVLTPGGNVGIGTTSPYAKLSVVGQVVASNFTATSTAATSTFMGGFNVGNGGLVYAKNSGSVGMGTLSPRSQLHVSGLQNSSLSVMAENASPGATASAGFSLRNNIGDIGSFRSYSSNNTLSHLASRLTLVTDSSNGLGIDLVSQKSTGDIRFYTGGGVATTNERFRITSSGFVGIGTTTPTSMLTVAGTTTIGNGTTGLQAGLQIGFGGLCVDDDGACTATTTGRITSMESLVGHSDLAEMYFSDSSLKPGEVVTLKGGLSIDLADQRGATPVLGVVSTKPGFTLGFDDSSLYPGETAFPVALSGRVPVKISTENGPVTRGDYLMLSSLPGIAMKATSTGTIIGIALEDFDEDRYYSDTYINQHSEDITRDRYREVTDARRSIINAELRGTPSESRYLYDGTSVSVGQVVMFVKLSERWISNKQMATLDILTSTPSITNIGSNKEETVFDRLVQLANNFIDGILSVFELRASRVEVTEELCIDGVCVTADDLRNLLNNQPTSVGTTGTESSSSNVKTNTNTNVVAPSGGTTVNPSAPTASTADPVDQLSTPADPAVAEPEPDNPTTATEPSEEVEVVTVVDAPEEILEAPATIAEEEASVDETVVDPMQ